MRQRIVRTQKPHCSKSSTTYWQWAKKNGETPYANPDLMEAVEEKNSETLQAILDVIDEGGEKILTHKQRDIFQLFVREGRSLQETGDLLGLSKSAVQQRLLCVTRKLHRLCYTKL